MLQVSIGQCQTQFSIGQCQFQFSFFRLLLFSIPSYRYVSLSVSKLRSLERVGVSELSQAQGDR
jgi:hypothetical protein